MAFNNPYYPMQMQQQMMNQPQNSGLILVRSEEEARNYPVAYGNSVTFKNEREPYIYSKTMGFSQLDRPIFEKYKLIKEETAEVENGATNTIIDNLKGEIADIWAEIKLIKDSRKKSEVQIDDECV